MENFAVIQHDIQAIQNVNIQTCLSFRNNRECGCRICRVMSKSVHAYESYRADLAGDIAIQNAHTKTCLSPRSDLELA